MLLNPTFLRTQTQNKKHPVITKIIPALQSLLGIVFVPQIKQLLLVSELVSQTYIYQKIITIQFIFCPWDSIEPYVGACVNSFPYKCFGIKPHLQTQISSYYSGTISVLLMFLLYFAPPIIVKMPKII